MSVIWDVRYWEVSLYDTLISFNNLFDYVIVKESVNEYLIKNSVCVS